MLRVSIYYCFRMLVIEPRNDESDDAGIFARPYANLTGKQSFNSECQSQTFVTASFENLL